MNYLSNIGHELKNSTEYAVLAYLCWNANDDNDQNVWHSQKTIARETSMSVNTVARTLKSLEKRGFIVRGDQDYAAMGKPQYRPIVWRIPVENGKGRSHAKKTDKPKKKPVVEAAKKLVEAITPTTPAKPAPVKPAKIQHPAPSPHITPADMENLLIREGHDPQHVHAAAQMWHNRADLYSPRSMRLLLGDIEKEHTTMATYRQFPFVSDPTPPRKTTSNYVGDQDTEYYEPPAPKLKQRPTYSPLARARAQQAAVRQGA